MNTRAVNLRDPQMEETKLQLARSVEALHDSNERTEQIIASALDAVVTMDIEGLITSWNPQAEIIFGWKAGEILGQRMSEVIIPPAYREAHERGRRHLLKTGEAKVLDRRMELTALRSDGEEFPIELTVAKVLVAGVTHFSAFIRDLTAQKQAEARLAEALQEKSRIERERLEELRDYSASLERRVAERTAEVERTRQQFQDLFEFGPDAMVMTDPGGEIQLINRQAEEMFGWMRTQLMGKQIKQLLPGDLQTAFADDHHHPLQTARTRPTETGESTLLGVHKDGTEFPVEIRLCPVQTKGGTLMAVAIRDVTERKQFEHELARISSHEQERLAHELHDHLGAYLGGIAFRFKALAETLQRRAIPEAATAQQLVLQINAGIDKVRNFARLIAPVELASGGLVAGLSQLAKELETVYGIVCQVATPRDLPSPTLEQNLQLYRIAQEATRNAVQHAKARHVTISLQLDTDHLIQTVVNDGQLWDPELAPVQGMGLRIMRHRAASLGGTLSIKANLARHTEVVCRIPLSPAGEVGENQKPAL